MNQIEYSVAVLVIAAATGLIAAGAWGLVRRLRPSSRPGTSGLTVLQRAASYAALALVLAVAVVTGTAGIAVLCAIIGAVGLFEWSRLTQLPIQHRLALQVANVAIIGSVAVLGPSAADVLVGGLALLGIAWPIVRSDTDRAVRDLGFAMVGCVILSVLLAHGVGLPYRYGDQGAALFAGLAVACALSDVGAFLVGRRFGSRKLAPRLSPNKTWAGVMGNLLGAGLGLVIFTPALAPWLGSWVLLLLLPLVAFGAIWGDLLESAVKREFGVKDAAAWLPGFGGILDRVDSLLVVLPLTYWTLRLVEQVG